jgi:hypothetical protein
MPTDLANLTTKQFGDACEWLVAAELALAGWPVCFNGAGYPGYDLSVDLPDGGRLRISVKGLRAGGGRRAADLRVDPAPTWDWLALVRIDLETGVRDIYVLPHQTVLAFSGGPDALGRHGLPCRGNPRLEPYRNNFRLDPAS